MKKLLPYAVFFLLTGATFSSAAQYKLNAYEYWFNDSYNEKISVSILPTGNHQLIENVDASALPDGMNVFNIRYKDEMNLYSSTLSKVFYKMSGAEAVNNRLVAYEVWFNNAFETRQINPISADKEHTVVAEIDVSLLPGGMNVVNVRYRDEKGIYSSTISRIFYKKDGAILADKTIAGYRYWFGDDYENSRSFSLATPVKQFRLAENLDISPLPKGDHALHFQFIDSEGMWSSVTTDSIKKLAIPDAAFSVSNTTLCSGIAVSFTNESIDADTWHWDFGDGQTSADFEPGHIFLAAGDFEVRLTATDSETGIESSTTRVVTIFPSFGSTLPSPGNIVAYYPFNGSANDESGYMHHGTVFGATPGADRFGNPDGAYSFDGINDYIDVGDWENGGPMSFNFWAKWEAWHNWSRLLDFGLGEQNNNIYIGNESTNDNLMFHTLDGSTKHLFYCNNTLPLDTWVMITCTVDENGVMKAYQDGTLIGTFNGFTPAKMVRTAQYFGKSNWPADGYFKGAIDEVIIYNIVLSGEEIQQIYNISENNIVPLAVETCSSELPYQFGTQELFNSGTYTETFATINGCDSTVTLNLTVHPGYNVPYSGADATISYLVNDSFEEIPVNTFPGDWTIRYEGTGSDDHYVVDNPTIMGAHALKVSGSGWAANLSKTVAGIPGNVTLEGWIRAENVATGGRCGLGLGNPAVGSWGAYPARVEFYNGNLITFYYIGSSGEYGTQYVLQPAAPDTWYHIKIETNAASQTYKIYINGSMASSSSGGNVVEEFPLYTGFPATSVELYGNSLVYFDDIRLYETGSSQVVVCESDLPFQFGDQQLTESGSYTGTFQSVHGCDSVVTLRLTVNPVYYHTEEAVICEGESFAYDGQTYTQAGEYLHTFSTAGGCDSLVTLQLTVNPVYYSTDAAAICQGETCLFGTQRLTEAGEYTGLFQSATGCDSTVVLTLSVHPEYTTTDEVVICQGETYRFGTQNLATAGEYTEVFQSATGCDSTVVLTLTINPGYTTTDAAAICQGDTYLFGPQSLTEAGEYTGVFQSATGCDSTVVLTLSVHPVFSETKETAIYADDLPFIFGSQTLIEEGTYIETFSSVNGCDSTVTLTLTVKPADVTPPVLVLNAATFSLNSSGQYTLTVTDLQALTAGSTDDNTAFADIRFTADPAVFTCSTTGDAVPVTITATDLRGNSSSAETVVTVTDQIPPQIYCSDVTLSLDDNGQAIVDVSRLYSFTDDACGIISVIADKTSFGCSDLGTVTVRVTASDVHNNTNSCTATVTVTDMLPPRIASVGDLTVDAEEGSCEAVVSYPEILASDNCEMAGVYLIEGRGPGSTFPVGTSVERWVASDNSGNTDTIRFRVTVEDNPAAPSADRIQDAELYEDAADYAIELLNLNDGSDCIEYPLHLDFLPGNPALIQSYEFSHQPGENNAQLYITPVPDAAGETSAVITIINEETGKQFSDTFSIRVLPVNDQPFVVRPPDNLDIPAGEALKKHFSNEAGVLFGDAEDTLMQLSLHTADGEALPAWLHFIGDTLEAYPDASSAGCYNLLLTATDAAGAGVSSPFMLCVNLTVGTETPDKAKISVYPNPSAGRVFVEYPQGSVTAIEICNSLGKTVLHKKVSDHRRIEIDMSDFVSGVYFLKATGRNTHFTDKIVLKTN